MIAPRTALVLLIALSLALGACRVSPWEDDPGCSDPWTANLSRLEAIEAADPQPDSFTVALIADIDNDYGDLETVIDRINSRNDVTFALVLGDMTNSGLAMEYGWTCDAMQELEVPRFYVIGNHDSISFGEQIFQQHFAPLNYVVDYGGTRFVLYNDSAGPVAARPDYGFIRNAAAVAPGETRIHTLAASHRAPQADPHSGIDVARLRQEFAAAGYGATLHGHLHVFDLTVDEHGVLHFISHETAGAAYGLVTLYRDGRIAFQGCMADCFTPAVQPAPPP